MSANILVITYWSYKDALVQTYTLPYLKIINRVRKGKGRIYLVTLEQNHLKISEEEKKLINSELAKNNIELVSFSYSNFGFLAIIKWFYFIIRLAILTFTEKIKTIHCWCTPAGAIGYILSLITGKDLIIDSYEPHAESMVENGTWGKNSIAFRLLFFLEKLQTKKAKHIIGLTNKTPEYALEKHRVKIANYYTKPACIDIENFNLVYDDNLRKELKIPEENRICVYAGKFGGIYFYEEIIDFFVHCLNFWNGKFTALVLTSSNHNEIVQIAKRKGFSTENIKLLFVPHDLVAKYLSIADFAVNPVVPVPSKKYCTSIKDGEYWANGLPVVISENISDDSEIIRNENAGIVVDFKNLEKTLDLSKIESLIINPNTKNNITNLADKHRNFSIAENIYTKIYVE